MTASPSQATGQPEDTVPEGAARCSIPARQPALLPTAWQLITSFTCQLSSQLRTVPPPRARHGTPRDG